MLLGHLLFVSLLERCSHGNETDLPGGRYLTEQRHRGALVAMLSDFSIPTGWPVKPIIEDLKIHWSATA